MSRATWPKFLAAGATVAVAASLVAAIVVLGGPSEQRQRRLDERRVNDLTTIVGAVGVYAGMHDALPPDLSVLGKEPGSRGAPSDPDTGAAYEYAVLGSDSYRLCAVFTAPLRDAPATRYGEREGWAHGAGRQCFVRKQKAATN